MSESAPSDVLFHRVYLPAFVKECQARGLVVDTNDEDELGNLLKIAYNLRVHAVSEAEQEQQSVKDTIKAAAAAFDTDAAAEPAEVSPLSAVADYVSDPEVVKAAQASLTPASEEASEE